MALVPCFFLAEPSPYGVPFTFIKIKILTNTERGKNRKARACCSDPERTVIVSLTKDVDEETLELWLRQTLPYIFSHVRKFEGDT
ncbi:15858_t:CDS:2, partial [Dentiscutata erythropus]